MSDTAESSSKPRGKRGERTDKQAFTQVEKWMAMIREIDQDRQSELKRGLSARHVGQATERGPTK